MFSKILVANRGEIAVRVMRTCREMGIKTVAVYSDADRSSLHTAYADEAVNIGPPLARKSYLNMGNIIEAARKTGAEAIHPGYGFLAENEQFSQTCADSGIKFIGPSALTHRMAGDKIESRRLAGKNGVPISPGSEGAVTAEEAQDIASTIGYPIIIKASGGGGGRGMRVANNDAELANFIKLSRGEAAAAFGNPNLFVEKYIVEPHHIEFQILGDQFGNYIHVGERECSIQKRYQKLIEESPSPFMDDTLRRRMAEAALSIARVVNYEGAGTVEFLVDRYRNFYFNEVNSRLQVEHPVTEMVTGIDLVCQQIIIASGGKLEYTQADIQSRGWAMECRINAEDTVNNFAPCPGKIDRIIFPGGFGVRVDSHLYGGYEVPPFYDSLVGKIVVWAKGRLTAIS